MSPDAQAIVEAIHQLGSLVIACTILIISTVIMMGSWNRRR